MISTTTYRPQSPHPANGGYRYFFNGQESDGEVLGEGALHAFEYRMHDTRIGRFWSVDPLAGKFPWNSTYAFAENRVIDGIELEGLEVAYTTTEFGSAVGLGQYGWNYVKGKGSAEDKVGITYFKYRSSFKISEEESVAGIMIANTSVHTGIDFSSDYFRQSINKGGITNVELYPMGGVSADGRWPDTYVGISLGVGLGIAVTTTKTEVDASFSISYEERLKLIDLVTKKGFTYNDSDPKLEVDDQYLYYVDTGNIFNLFKETRIKTNIKMVNIKDEQWESVQYQQKLKTIISK